MARQSLQHIVQPVYTQQSTDESFTKNIFLTSGAVTLDSEMSAALVGKGKVWSAPSFITPDVADSEANKPTSDSSVRAPTESLSSHSQNYVRNAYNKNYDFNSLVPTLIGADPMGALVSSTAVVMNQWRQRDLMTQIDALMLKSGSVLAGSVVKIAAESIATQSTSTKVAGKAINLLLDTINNAWSDADPAGLMLVMHPDLYTAIAKENVTSTFVPLAQQDPRFKNFLGYAVHTDKNIGKRAGTTDGFVYTCYVIRTGGISMGQADFAPGFEITRDALAGNGAGQDIVSLREYFTFWVKGTSFKDAPAADVVSVAELGTAAKYELVLDRRAVGIAAFQVNI